MTAPRVSRLSWMATVFSLLAATSLVGCGGGEPPPERETTVPVSGVVIFDGKPIEGATVGFIPDSGQEKGAVGQTDAEGKFQLMTYEPGDGAIPGKYKVTVAKSVVEGGSPDDGLAPPPVTKHIIPVRYNDPKSSGLIATVKEGENKELKFELTK